MTLLAALAVGIMKGMLEVVLGRDYEVSGVACPGCRGRMKFRRYARRPVISGFGRFSCERAYYYCRRCGQGRAPLDEQLQISHRRVSPRLQRVIGFLSGHLSFAVVGKSLKESLQIEVSNETIRQVAAEWGQQARDWEEQQRQMYEEAPVVSQPRRAQPKTWVLEVDGKKIGYQDGSWLETKVGVIYELSDRVESERGRHELVKRELIARGCEWLEFSYHVGAAMRLVGHPAGGSAGDGSRRSHRDPADFCGGAGGDLRPRLLPYGRAALDDRRTALRGANGSRSTMD
ncbi:MAG: UPF0236 family protein [Blastocatellia bacterium]|nr:UPF0236 family protein [Blastocatellia bacterium]